MQKNYKIEIMSGPAIHFKSMPAFLEQSDLALSESPPRNLSGQVGMLF